MNELSEILGEIRLLKKEIALLKEAINVQTVKEQMFGPWIREKETIEITECSRGTLDRMKNDGEILGTKLSGKENFYLKSSFRKLLDKNSKK